MAAEHKYKPEMNDIILELMSQGASQFEVSVELGIAKSTLYNWLDEDHPSFCPEFKKVIAQGNIAGQAWWEKQLRQAAVGTNKDANATLMIFNMKNRFKDDWSDVQKVESNVNFAQVSDQPASSDEWLKEHKPQ